MRVLGISAYYHDSAAAFIENGSIKFCAQEERFTRVKHDSSFPQRSILAGLKFCNWSPIEIDYIVFYEKPFLKFERIMYTLLEAGPSGWPFFKNAIPLWLTKKLDQKQLINDNLKRIGINVNPDKILFSQHHLSHAASAYYPSGLNKALILTVDGLGEWSSTAVFTAEGSVITPHLEIHFPHSLGLLYSSITMYCGFKVNSGEYKLMGLAPYGKPKYFDHILKHLIELHEDGSFSLNQDFFNYFVDTKSFNYAWEKVVGFPPREPESPIRRQDMDLACSIQKALEHTILHLLKQIKKKIPGYDNLCLAGGVALNCVANQKIYESSLFQKIWIQPAAGDAGAALGAALSFYYYRNPSVNHLPSKLRDAFLGNCYSDEEYRRALEHSQLAFIHISDEPSLIEKVAQLLADGFVIGLHRGRMEFGPRALGHRSILASPLPHDAQKRINMKIKFRESFRPFAPIVCQDDCAKYFEPIGDFSFMLVTTKIKSLWINNPMNESEQPDIDWVNHVRSPFPAVTHIDYSARVQTIDYHTEPWLYLLLKSFGNKTSFPMLVNTSFNVRGEPIVESPQDAIRCFLGTHLDALVLGNYLVLKSDVPKEYLNVYHETLPPD